MPGSEPIEQVVRRAVGQTVNLGGRICRPRLAMVAVTARAGLVLHTQTDTVILPPGVGDDSCLMICAKTQSAPGFGVGVGVGVGDGLVESDGLGLELDGLGLGLELDGLGLGLDELELDGLALGLELDELELDVLGLGLERLKLDRLGLELNRTARTAAAVPPPHGE